MTAAARIDTPAQPLSLDELETSIQSAKKALLALGVYLSFRIFGFSDITTEGTITLGAAVTAILLVKGVNPFAATAAGCIAGLIAGAVTGIIHTRFGINGLLSGILVMTALYSINLHVMGKSNVPLLAGENFTTQAEKLGHMVFGSETVNVAGWDVSSRHISVLIVAALSVMVTSILLYMFLRTDLGTALRATGDNAQMIRDPRLDEYLRAHRTSVATDAFVPTMRTVANGANFSQDNSQE